MLHPTNRDVLSKYQHIPSLAREPGPLQYLDLSKAVDSSTSPSSKSLRLAALVAEGLCDERIVCLQTCYTMYNPHSQAVPYGLATYVHAQTLHEMKQAMKAST